MNSLSTSCQLRSAQPEFSQWMVHSGSEMPAHPHWLADEASNFGPVFWHLDGCNVDEFEFSSYVTREEYEAQLENDA
jgi:hypothetical protein